MTEKANELLCKMKTAYDSGHENNFDSTFYLGYPEVVITELSDDGYIVALNNIVGTIKLTQEGYEAAKQ